MKIYIDGQLADVDEGTTVAVSAAVASLTKIDTGKTGYSKSIVLPMTTRNRKIVGDVEQVHSPAKFNDGEHTAFIESEGSRVIEGTPYLMSCRDHYDFVIIGAGKEWAKYASATSLRNLPLDFSETITPAMIAQSWTWDKPVRFLPVQRDGFAVENPKANLFPPVKVLTFEDYHPFLHVRAVLEKIFETAGYRIASQFVSNELFGSLYMSGNYPRKDTAALRSRMDFKAGRVAETRSTASSMGVVHADPYRTGNSVGNIVQTADPEEVSGGVSIGGVFTVGGYFGKDDDRVVFAPPVAVTVGFEYGIFYTTDYYMESRERLKGFDRVNLGDGQTRQYMIANRNVDRRSSISAGRSYMAIIFGYESGNSYQLRYGEVTNPAADMDNITAGDITMRTYTTFTGRTTTVAISSANRICNPQVWVKWQGATGYVLYEDDWAIYDGYVKERGQVDVELKVRSSAERITPSNPKFFDTIYFAGADPGMTFVLGKQTTVKPVFAEHPSEGTTVDFTQVASHDATCLDFVNSLRQMFNLYFYTDELTKTVFIEPRDIFFRSDTIVDWSGREDFSKAVTVSEPGGDMAQSTSFEYRTGDGAVGRWNITNGQMLGCWKAQVNSRLARQGQSAYVNGMFTASLNIAGDYPDASAAWLLQAGGREPENPERQENLNFEPKIVRYMGMVELPEGQRWGWPSNGSLYPFAAFHYKGSDNVYRDGEVNPLSSFSVDRDVLLENGFSLCFEDRDGVAGLNRYWKSVFKSCNESKRMELNIVLKPGDVEQLISPDRLGRDFRALFRLMIDGEQGLFRLEQVCDYNPAAGGSARCVFIKEV